MSFNFNKKTTTPLNSETDLNLYSQRLFNSSEGLASEIEGLLKQNKESALRENLKIFFDKVGGISTFLAMTTQGFLAFLLTDKLLKEKGLPISARLLFDIAMFINATGGKHGLIRFYNKRDFINLVDLRFSSFFPEGTTPKNLFNYLQKVFSYFLTSNISSTFTGITLLSCMQSAKFLDNYNLTITDLFKSALNNLAVQSIFGASSFLSNIVANPTINRLAWNLLTGAIEYPLINPNYRQITEDYTERLETTLHKLLQEQRRLIYANSKTLETLPLLEDPNQKTIADAILEKLASENFQIKINLQKVTKNKGIDDSTRQKLVQYLKNAFNTDKVPTELTDNKEKLACLLLAALSESSTFRKAIILANQATATKRGRIDVWLDFVLQHFLAAGATFIAMFGLINFLQMTKDTWNEFAKDYDFPQFNTNELDYFTMLSMFNLTIIAVYPNVQDFSKKIVYPLFKYGFYQAACNQKTLEDCGFAKNYEVSLMSKRQVAWILTVSLLICFFGGFTNEEQQELAQDNEQHNSLTSFKETSALLSPFFIEIFGFIAYLYMSFETDLISDSKIPTGIIASSLYFLGYLNPFFYSTLLFDLFTKPTIPEDKKEDANLFFKLKNAVGSFGILDTAGVDEDVPMLFETEKNNTCSDKYFTFVKNIGNSSYAKNINNFWGNYSLYQRKFLEKEQLIEEEAPNNSPNQIN